MGKMCYPAAEVHNTQAKKQFEARKNEHKIFGLKRNRWKQQTDDIVGKLHAIADHQAENGPRSTQHWHVLEVILHDLFLRISRADFQIFDQQIQHHPTEAH